MNKQEALDKNWEWFVSQGHERSYVDEWDEDGDGYEGCAYRGENGCRCAVGCLIPDDRYCPGMEKYRITHAWIQGHHLEDLFPAYLVDFLSTLQVAHDTYGPSWGDFTAYMERRLRTIAKEHDLTIPNTTLAA